MNWNIFKKVFTAKQQEIQGKYFGTRDRRYGWVPDFPDIRDHMYKLTIAVKKLPPAIDLRKWCSKVEDQGNLGSCTANALVGGLEFLELRPAQLTDEDFKEALKCSSPFVDYSRLFIYYNEREMEGSVKEDSGAQIRDGIKCLAKQGVCPELMWPYDVHKFAVKPNSQCYDTAKQNVITTYRRLNTLNDMKGALAEGYPFMFGFTVYESFESLEVSKSGIANMPTSGDRVVGGHAVLGVGYDDATQRVLVRNSWSEGWGMYGYFTLPYQYVSNSHLADDFWTVTSKKV